MGPPDRSESAVGHDRATPLLRIAYTLVLRGERFGYPADAYDILGIPARIVTEILFDLRPFASRVLVYVVCRIFVLSFQRSVCERQALPHRTEFPERPSCKYAIHLAHLLTVFPSVPSFFRRYILVLVSYTNAPLRLYLYSL